MAVNIHAFQLGATGECIITYCFNSLRNKERRDSRTAPAGARPDFFYLLRYLEMTFIGGRAELQPEAPRVLDIQYAVDHGIQLILTIQFEGLEFRPVERSLAVPRMLIYKTRIRSKHEPLYGCISKRFDADLLDVLAKVYLTQ